MTTWVPPRYPQLLPSYSPVIPQLPPSYLLVTPQLPPIYSLSLPPPPSKAVGCIFLGGLYNNAPWPVGNKEEVNNAPSYTPYLYTPYPYTPYPYTPCPYTPPTPLHPPCTPPTPQTRSAPLTLSCTPFLSLSHSYSSPDKKEVTQILFFFSC